MRYSILCLVFLFGGVIEFKLKPNGLEKEDIQSARSTTSFDKVSQIEVLDQIIHDALDSINFDLPRYYQTLQDPKERIEYILITKDSSGVTPLNALALKHEQPIEIFETILTLPKFGIDIDINEIDDTSRTPLINAVLNGNEDLVNLLLKQTKLEINKRDKQGNSAFRWANMIENRNNIRERLLQNGGVW